MMRNTTNTEARLATCHDLPTGRGYRSPVLYERLTHARPRKDAHEVLCREASAKPQWLRDHRSKPETHSLPDIRQHDAIMDLIAQGAMTDDTLIDYFGALVAVYLPLIQHQREADYLAVAREKSEAAEWTMKARMDSTPENRQRAAKELCDDIVASTAHAKRLQGGSAA